MVKRQWLTLPSTTAAAACAVGKGRLYAAASVVAVGTLRSDESVTYSTEESSELVLTDWELEPPST